MMTHTKRVMNIYYNMVDFLDDAEVHQIWEIVGNENNIVTSDNESQE